jgi:preprotein translocase subunit SecD
MRSLLNLMACMILHLSPSALQAQLSIHAASAAPVESWQRMQVEHSDRVIWISPTAAISASDIEQATAAVVRPEGIRMIVITFTDVGAQKARDLSIEQRNKLVALVVDNKVLSVWAPNLRSEVTKESALTGNTPTGLTKEEVERIMSILR